MEVTGMRYVIVLVAVIIGTVLPCYAYNGETHQRVTEYVARGNIEEFELDTYLKEHLDFRFGFQEIITSPLIMPSFQIQVSKSIEGILI